MIQPSLLPDEEAAWEVRHERHAGSGMISYPIARLRATGQGAALTVAAATYPAPAGWWLDVIPVPEGARPLWATIEADLARAWTADDPPAEPGEEPPC